MDAQEGRRWQEATDTGEKKRIWEEEIRQTNPQEKAERKAKRRAWCQERAAAGLPVPDATDAELREHPGLKRS